MNRITLCTLIFFTHALFCADPHQELRDALKDSMSDDEIEQLIKQDQQMRASPTLARPDMNITSQSPVLSTDRTAFQKEMALRARNAKFGNLGK